MNWFFLPSVLICDFVYKTIKLNFVKINATIKTKIKNPLVLLPFAAILVSDEDR